MSGQNPLVGADDTLETLGFVPEQEPCAKKEEEQKKE